MTRRRTFLGALSSALPGVAFGADAETVGRMLRIGLLPATATSPAFQALREGLGELGYVEGRNLVIEARDGRPTNDRLPALASELAAVPVDVIVTQGPYGLQAAKDTTKTIPIVFTGVGANFPGLRSDPNLTGVAEEIIGSTVTRLELLKEVVPRLDRAAVLANPNNYGTRDYLNACQTWAHTAGVGLHVYDVRDPDDVPRAFAKMSLDQIQGLIAFTDSVIFRQREVIVQTALKQRVPGCYPYREWVSAGGLLSYGPNFTATLRGLVPIMIDRILKGTKPSDIAVERPRSEIFINARTAAAMGMTIPASLLRRAAEVIQ
jgi:putative ABC transport system substrate-binding protein